MPDLIVLTADDQQRVAIETLLSDRHNSLGIRLLSHTVLRHANSDGGVYTGAGEFLSIYRGEYTHALVVLDLDWQGSPGDAEAIRNEVSRQLERTGWERGSYEVIVITPELEAWVWIRDNPHLASILGVGWDAIYACAVKYGFWDQGAPKPRRPKELLEQVLRENKGRPRNSGLYRDIAARVGLRQCTDPAFQLFRNTVVRWFPRS